MCFKYIQLKLRRFTHKIFNRLPTALSYIFLAFSALVSFILLVFTCFNRAPVLSYSISELELPMTYELYGKVSVLDKNDDIINKNVEVFIGGYKTFIGASKEFNLKFVSPETSEVFIVIRYEVDEEKFEFTRGLVIEDNNYIIKEEFTIHV